MTYFLRAGVQSLIPAPAGITGPPAPALSAGFNRLVFNDDFTTNSVARSAGASDNYNWYWCYSGIQSIADFSIDFGPGAGATAGANGVLTINKCGNTYNAALQTIPQNANGSPVQPGCWKHAYFEARIQFSPTVLGAGGPSGGWPSWWSNAVEGQAPVDGNITAECDFMEYYPNGPAGSTGSVLSTMHNWRNSATGSNVTDLFNSNGTSKAQASQQPSDGAWHVYGCLWTGNGTTGTVKFFYDNQLVAHDNGVTSYALDAGGVPSAAFTAMEGNNMAMFLGTATGWPINVDWVRVWQA